MTDCSSNSTENAEGEPASVYSELHDVVDDYDVIGPSATDETGYMVPVHDGSPGPLPYYMVPLPTPPPSYYNFKQDPNSGDNSSPGADSGCQSNLFLVYCDSEKDHGHF